MAWSLFRSKPPVEHPQKEVTPMLAQHGEKRVSKTWCFDTADYVYQVEMYAGNWRHPLGKCSENGQDHYWEHYAGGDETWASRNAEHLGVEIVEADGIVRVLPQIQRVE